MTPTIPTVEQRAYVTLGAIGAGAGTGVAGAGVSSGVQPAVIYGIRQGYSSRLAAT